MLSTVTAPLAAPARDAPLAGLRVAYLAFESFPNAKGSGTRIAAMSSALADAGAEPHLVTLPSRQLGERVHPSVVYRPQRVLHDNFLARALAFQRAAARALRAIRPDVVHFRGVFEGQAALSYARARAIPAIFEVNGLPSVELQYHHPAVGEAQELLLRLRESERRCLAAATRVITQSQTTLAFLRDRGLPPSTPAAVIHNAADPPPTPSPAPAPPGPPEVLYVGTVAPWQGVAELLMAARRCLRVRPLTLTIAGPARRRWRKQLERACKRLKIQRAVELTGALGRRAIAERVARATVCVAPLRRDVRNKHQGCNPIKLYEYMAAARPIIATDLPCTREIIEHDRTGLLLPSPRPKLLAEALLELLADPARQARLGAQARAEVLAHATWRTRQAQLVRVYQDLLA